MPGQRTTSEAPVTPFSQVTIGDANIGATDTLTITLDGVGGTLADGTGFTSLATVSAAVYSLSGTAAAITSELDALVFTPIGRSARHDLHNDVHAKRSEQRQRRACY